MRFFVVRLLLAGLFCLGTLGVPVSRSNTDALCRLAVPSKDNTWGVNRVTGDSWDPLFKLDLKRGGKNEYTVAMKLGSRVIPFSDAIITAETNGSCGVGELHYDNDDFYQVRQTSQNCPLLLATNRKSAMHQLPPLRWKAPECGCVHFRAMVIEMSETYYAERVGVVDGPLAATICTENSSHLPKKLSREERTELLCRVTERFSGLEVVQRSDFLARHSLTPHYIDRAAMELALSTRRHDITSCCEKSGDTRQVCFMDIRRHRVDEFCADGFPDIPFTTLRSQFMREREDACCWRLGEARYDCFAVDAHTKHGQWSADFTLDEADPLNDLGDYPDEIRSLEKEYGMSLFHSDEGHHLPTTTTSTTTTTTTTTTTPPPPPPPSPPRTYLSDNERFLQYEGQAAAAAGGSSRRGGAAAFGRARSEERAPSVGTGRVEEAFSKEVGEEQNSRSTDKTVFRLQRRMQKLSLKTRCCEAGVAAAGSAYGDFTAVWRQCQDSANKMLTSQHVRSGSKICIDQFHKCCMEIAISGPSEEVTWQPDEAPSSEWDPDRHQVNKLYLPPHMRGPYSRTSAPRASSREQTSQAAVVARAQLRGTSFVDEADVDDDPRSKRQRTSGDVATSTSRVQQRIPHVAENVDAPEIDQNPPVSRRHRVSGGRSNRRRGGISRRVPGGRSRIRRLEQEGSHEEPTLKTSTERRARLGTGSRRQYSARRMLVDEPEIDEEPMLKRQQARSQEVQTRGGSKQVHDDLTYTDKELTDQERQKIRRHQLEQRQLKKLLKEIEDDIDNDEHADVDDDNADADSAREDTGSEESQDALAMQEDDDEDANNADSADDNDDRDDESNNKQETEREQPPNVEAKPETDNDPENQSSETSDADDTATGQSTQLTSSQTDNGGDEKNTTQSPLSSKGPETSNQNQGHHRSAQTKSSQERDPQGPTPTIPEPSRQISSSRARSGGLSEDLSEDGHGSRRNGKTRRRRPQRMYRHGNHMRYRHRRRRVMDLEPIEED